MAKPWGKTEQERLRRVFAYLANPMGVTQETRQRLKDWVEGGSMHSSASLSGAIALGRRPFFGYDQGQREALRVCVLARIAAERPDNLLTTEQWKQAWKSEKESALQARAKQYLLQFSPIDPPASKPASAPQPKMYGVASLQQVLGAKQKLSAPVARRDPVGMAAAPALREATSTTRPTVREARQAFDAVSRSHVVFSGHGSWKFDPTINDWPFVKLGPRQKMRYYIAHYWPLGNAVGQMVDSRRFPAPTNEAAGGSTVCDYTLHHRGDLKLLNHSKGDTKFVTVDRDTRLSQLINDPEYDAVTFHWAACRVVFDQTGGKLWCPNHADWEVYQQGQPMPCVLR